MAIATEELVQAGLCEGPEGHHLTAKGRDWLHALEQAQVSQTGEMNEGPADLVLSTNGLFR